MQSFKSLLGIAAFSAIAIAPAVHAQTPAAVPAAAAPVVAGPPLVAPTIALVDMQRVLRESAAGKSIQSQLETESRKFRDQVQKLQEDLKNGENDFKRQRAVMSPDAANDQGQSLQRKQAEAQRTVQERQEALQRAENDAVNVVGDNMRDIVQTLVGERHIGMVLQKQFVISVADKNMDITDDVIQRLNAKLPSVTVTVPAPGAAAAAAAAPAAAADKTPKKK